MSNEDKLLKSLEIKAHSENELIDIVKENPNFVKKSGFFTEIFKPYLDKIKQALSIKKKKKRFADAIIFNNEGKFLMLLRGSNTEIEPNKWCLPGGHVDEGESFEQACIREVLEETNLVVDSVNLRLVRNESDFEIRYFACFLDQDQLHILDADEHKGLKWVDKKELKELDCIFDLKEVLLELLYGEQQTKNQSAYRKGCLMLKFPDQGWDEACKTLISEEDLYKDTEGGYGFETDPHITVLYGFDPKYTGEEVQESLNNFLSTNPIRVRLKGISCFENENRPYDVVKWDVESEDLELLNAYLKTQFDYENEFDTYIPHMTIAYVNKGEGKKYEIENEKVSTIYNLNGYVYSDTEKNKYHFYIPNEVEDIIEKSVKKIRHVRKDTGKVYFENHHVNDNTETPKRGNVMNYLEALCKMNSHPKQKAFFEWQLNNARNVEMTLVKDICLKYPEIGEYVKKENIAIKQCYMNSAKLAMVVPGVSMVEGFVSVAGIPIEHAWNKIGDEYFDLTQDIALGSNRIKLFHSTTPDIAKKIEKEGFDLSHSADGSMWFTTSKEKIQNNEVGASYGGAIIERTIDESKLKLGGYEEQDKYSIDELINMEYDGLKLVDDDEVTYQLFEPNKVLSKQKIGVVFPEHVSVIELDADDVYHFADLTGHYGSYLSDKFKQDTGISKADEPSKLGDEKKWHGRKFKFTSEGWAHADDKPSALKEDLNGRKLKIQDFTDEDLERHAERSSISDLQNVVKESRHPRLRDLAMKHLATRKAKENEHSLYSLMILEDADEKEPTDLDTIHFDDEPDQELIEKLHYHGIPYLISSKEVKQKNKSNSKK